MIAASTDAVYWARKQFFGAQAEMYDQHLAHKVVTVVQPAHGATVDRLAHAALVAAADRGAVVD